MTICKGADNKKGHTLLQEPDFITRTLRLKSRDCNPAMAIPCDAKYYFVKLASDLALSVEAGPIQKMPRGSFTLYESPMAPGPYEPGQTYIVGYGDKQNLRRTESYPRIHLLPYTNMPVTVLRTLDISHLVRLSPTEEALRSQGIAFHPQPRLVAIVKGLLDESVYAGPAGYLTNAWTFVVGESYSIREYQGACGTWRLLSEDVAVFLGDSLWSDRGTLKAGSYDEGNYRLITGVDKTNAQYNPTIVKT
jgi:hypothetical protein